ncbi:MAG: hypothetical protein K2J47_02320, partial [Ruminococcus sp.]|nr:hypothetical protein [Ruminococcus sp.]
MNINKKMQDILKKHKSDRKKASWTVILSLVVVLTVITSLITPAVSMTIEDSPLAAMGLIGALGENGEKKQGNTSGALEIISEYVTSLNAVGIDEEYDGDSASFEFSLAYTLPADSRDSLNLESEPNLYISLNNVKAGYLDDDASLNTISDIAFGGTAGTFVITENGITISFTDEYKEYLKTGSDGEILGTLRFSGEIKRDESESGDKTVNIAGKDIDVKFKDRVPDVSKNSLSNVVLNKNGDRVVKWQVNITSNGADLSKYDVSDLINGKTANLTNVQFNPSTSGSFSDGKISLNGTQNVAITYETILTEEMLDADIKNEFTIKHGSDKPHSSKASIKPTAFSVEKTGSADYSDYENKKIKWTVTVNNPLKRDLDGYSIADTMVPAAEVSNLQVTEPSGGKISDDWKLSNVGEAGTIVIEYETAAEAGTTYNNKVQLKTPDGEPTGEPDEEKVKYKDTSEVIQLSKNGVYDGDKREITWTVTVSSDGNYKFKDYEVTDKKFPNDIDVDVKYYKDGEAVNASGAVRKDNTYTITDSADSKSFDTVVFEYKTKVEVPEDAPTTTVINEVEGKNGTATTVVSDKVDVYFRNGIAKNLSNSSNKKTTVTGSEEFTKDFEWEVILNRDAKFAGQTYTDIISAPDNATHTLKENSIEVYVSEDGKNYTEITEGYMVANTDTDDGFTLTFDENFDSTNDYNFVKIKYKTTATIDAANAATDYKDYKFKNVGQWGDKNSEREVTITRKEQLNITVKKEWAGTSNGTNAVVELQFTSAAVNWQWIPVKHGETEGTYVLSETSDAESVQIKLNSDNEWKTTFSNLPDNIDGNEVTYRIVEISFNDDSEHEVGKDNNRVVLENGWYDISYSKNEIKQAGTITVKNTYKTSTTKKLTVNKKFGDGVSADMFEDITVQLQQRRSDNNEWNPYTEDTSRNTVTLDSNNNWSYTWEALPYEEVIDGKVITYYYQVVETSYIGENSDKHTINGTVYKIGDNYYQYSSSENGNKYIITNSKYSNTDTKDITPSKFWAGDDDFKTDRPDKIVFVLQKKNYDGTWEDVHGKLDTSDLDNSDVPDYEKKVTVNVDESSSDIIKITLSGDKNGYQYSYESGNDYVNTLSGLPKYDFHENLDGSIVRYEIEYNFREAAFIVNNKQIEPQTDGSFKTANGSYSRDENETREGVVTNKFTRASGVEKTALDYNGSSIGYIDSTELKQNEECPYYAEIDGGKYYVFNWQISYKDASQLSTLEDELPSGFTLCTDSEYNHDNYWIANYIQQKTPEEVLKYFKTNYYKTPVKVAGDATCIG